MKVSKLVFIPLLRLRIRKKGSRKELGERMGCGGGVRIIGGDVRIIGGGGGSY